MTTALSTFVQADYYILNSQNQPMKSSSMYEYKAWHDKLPDELKTTKGMRLAADWDDKTVISTVFLGNAHGYHEESGEPVLWETILICNKVKELYRYVSHDEAMMAHQALCISFLEGH
jgi:hypothetical protein